MHLLAALLLVEAGVRPQLLHLLHLVLERFFDLGHLVVLQAKARLQLFQALLDRGATLGLLAALGFFLQLRFQLGDERQRLYREIVQVHDHQ